MAVWWFEDYMPVCEGVGWRLCMCCLTECVWVRVSVYVCGVRYLQYECVVSIPVYVHACVGVLVCACVSV